MKGQTCGLCGRGDGELIQDHTQWIPEQEFSQLCPLMGRDASRKICMKLCITKISCFKGT